MHVGNTIFMIPMARAARLSQHGAARRATSVGRETKGKGKGEGSKTDVSTYFLGSTQKAL